MIIANWDNIAQAEREVAQTGSNEHMLLEAVIELKRCVDNLQCRLERQSERSATGEQAQALQKALQEQIIENAALVHFAKRLLAADKRTPLALNRTSLIEVPDRGFFIVPQEIADYVQQLKDRAQ